MSGNRSANRLKLDEPRLDFQDATRFELSSHLFSVALGDFQDRDTRLTYRRRHPPCVRDCLLLCVESLGMQGALLSVLSFNKTLVPVLREIDLAAAAESSRGNSTLRDAGQYATRSGATMLAEWPLLQPDRFCYLSFILCRANAGRKIFSVRTSGSALGRKRAPPIQATIR